MKVILSTLAFLAVAFDSANAQSYSSSLSSYPSYSSATSSSSLGSILGSTSSLGSTLSSLASRYTGSLGSTTTSYTPSTTRYTPSTTTSYTPSTTSTLSSTRYTPSTTSSYTPSTISSYTPSTTSSYTPSTTSSYSSYTPSTTSSYTPSSSVSFGSASTWTDPRIKAYPKVKSYLKKKDLFDQSELRSYNLQINPSDFSKMKADPAAEKWYPCTVTVDYGKQTQQDFEGAGCRYKGSVGSLRMCLDPVSGREDGSCRKISIKVDSNKFNSNKQKIAGLNKMNFHGMAVDHSLLAERSVYNMFQTAGIPSPRAVNAKLYFNGGYDGVYGFVEAVDDEFLEDHFKDDYNEGKGALYKEAWIQNRGISYFEKKRQNDKNEDAWMMEVVQAVERASTSNADAVLSQYFDTQSFVDVTAINTLVGATDDWRIRHNFWWYVREDENGKKLVMLPWDYDRINDERADSRGPAPGRAWHDTMQAYSSACNKRETTAAQKARAEGHAWNQLEFWTSVNEQLPPDVDIPVQCDKITHLLSAALKDDVDRRVLELADVVASSAAIDGNLDSWYRQLASSVASDRSGDPPSQWTFQSEVNTMKNWLKQRKQKAVREAQGGYGSFYNSPAATMFGTGALTSSTVGTQFGSGFNTRSFGSIFGR